MILCSLNRLQKGKTFNFKSKAFYTEKLYLQVITYNYILFRKKTLFHVYNFLKLGLPLHLPSFLDQRTPNPFIFNFEEINSPVSSLFLLGYNPCWALLTTQTYPKIREKKIHNGKSSKTLKKKKYRVIAIFFKEYNN